MPSSKGSSWPGVEPACLMSPAFTGVFFTTEVKWSCSVLSDSLRLHGLQPTRLLRPWNFPGKNTGVGCHFLLQEFFSTQGMNPGLLHYRQTLDRLSHQGSPRALLLFYISGSLKSVPLGYIPDFDRAAFLSGDYRGESVSSPFCLLWTVSIPWLLAAFMPWKPAMASQVFYIASVQHQLSFPLSFITSVVILGHLDNSWWSPHLKILNLITYAKLLLHGT